MLQEGPVPGTSSIRVTRFHIGEDTKRDAQGFVKLAVELLGVAASMTQNVPYLGIVSGILTEMVKIEDEVDAYKQEWRATMTSARQIKAVVDNIRQQCSSAMGTEDALPDALKEPFDDLEKCLVRTVETLSACQAQTANKQSLSRTKRLKARIRERISRKVLSSEVQDRRRDMQAALHLFNTKLQIDQSLRIHAMVPILAELRDAQRVHVASSQVELRATDIYSMELLPAAPAIFHGRAREIDHIVNLTEYSASARVAVLGPGGIGKTCVALAVLHRPEIERRFAHRRYFVSCEALASAECIVLELMKTFGLTYESQSGLAPHDYLILHLRTLSNLILCLDNLETPWDADVQATEALLSRLAMLPHITLIITARGTDRPLQIAWSKPLLPPLEPISLDAALATWDGICGSHDEFSVKLLRAVDCVPLAVVVLAHIGESESSETLWERWQHEQAGLLRVRGSDTRLTNVYASIQLSLCSPRLQGSNGACAFLSIVCTLPQGVPESRIPVFVADLARHFPDLRNLITLLKQCSLVYSSQDGYLRVLSPVRHFMRVVHPIPDSLLECLYEQYRGMVTFPAADYQAEKDHTVANLAKELGNVADVFALCLIRIRQPYPKEPPIDLLKATLNFLHLGRTVLYYNISLIDHALGCVRVYDLPAVEARLWTLRGVSQHDIFATHAAIASFSQALDLHRASGDIQGEGDCLNAMSDAYYHLDLIRHAEQSLLSALRLHVSVQNHHGTASTQQRLARLYLQLGRLDEAHTMLDLALRTFIKLCDGVGFANSLQTMGELYVRSGQFEDAERALRDALRQHRALDDSRGEAVALLTIGSVYLNTLRLEEAKESLQSALDIYRHLGDVLGEASGLEAMGTVYQRLDQLSDAEQCLSSAFTLYRSASNRHGEAKTLNRLGNVYRHLLQYSQAQSCSQAALELSENISYTIGQGNAHRNLGLVCRDIDQYDEAESKLKCALAYYAVVQHTEKINITQDDLDFIFTLRLREGPFGRKKSREHSDPETGTLRRSCSRASSASSRRGVEGRGRDAADA